MRPRDRRGLRAQSGSRPPEPLSTPLIDFMNLERPATERAPLQGTGMLTKKGKYGLKALCHLSGLAPGDLAFVGEIAAANNIPKKFLDAILAELRNAGFVFSRKGKTGGYSLARPASEIKIGHVVRVLDGPLAPIPCASKTRYQPCDDCDEATCRVRRLMLDVRNAIAQVLDNTSLSDMQDMGGVDTLPEAEKIA
jgi:Rrf2 family protein